MVRLIHVITILVFVELLFLATGQLCNENRCSLSSNIFDAILSFSTGDLTATGFVLELFGDFATLFTSTTGIAALLATGGAVFIGTFLATREFKILIIPIIISLMVMLSDWILVAQRLAEINPVLSVFLMAPFAITYVLIVLGWWRGIG